MTSRHLDWTRLSRIGVLTAALVIVSAPVAAAQQICLPAIPEARASVNRYLQVSSDLPWLRSHGVMATQVEDLQPLVDATDAALCRKIDSTATILPAYYFRAGAYIIGTDAQPSPRDPATGAPIRPRRDEFRPLAFVFDSTGRFINIQRETVVAPPDLH